MFLIKLIKMLNVLYGKIRDWGNVIDIGEEFDMIRSCNCRTKLTNEAKQLIEEILESK